MVYLGLVRKISLKLPVCKPIFDTTLPIILRPVFERHVSPRRVTHDSWALTFQTYSAVFLFLRRADTVNVSYMQQRQLEHSNFRLSLRSASDNHGYIFKKLSQ